MRTRKENSRFNYNNRYNQNEKEKVNKTIYIQKMLKKKI